MLRLRTCLPLAALLLGALCPSSRGEDPPELNAPLTLVISLEHPLPAATEAEMHREMDKLMLQASIRVEWKQLSDFSVGTEVHDLVLVKFRGNCRIQPTPMFLVDERGPMAFTHTSDGEVLPFSEVLCDRVGVAAQSAMEVGEIGRRDELLGRALARVVAHELYHIKGKCNDHGRSGVARKALTGRELIAGTFDFAPADARRIVRGGE
jgi:hypothetical protein